MILLDTNVVSETFRPVPDPNVLAWLDAQARDTLYLTSHTVAELLFGIRMLPPGGRRQRLADAAEAVFELFAGRVLPFDDAAARCYAELAANARKAGLGFPAVDGYIAAIAANHGFKVATRDTSAFEAAGISVINPWQPKG